MAQGQQFCPISSHPTASPRNGVFTGAGSAVGYVSCRRGAVVSAIAHWTGTLSGSFTFDVSNDFNPKDQTGRWTSLTGAAMPASPAGAPGNAGINFTAFGYGALRITYTNAGGSGNMDVCVDVKEQG